MGRKTGRGARLCLRAAAVLLIVAPCAAGAQAAGVRSVVIFSADEHEARLTAVRQAVAFWNGTFAGLGLQPPFLEPQIVIRAPAARALETYALRVSGDGWRLGAGAEGLEPPLAVTSLDGDLIVLLSAQRILSFAWPIGDAARYFVAIRSDRIPPLDAPGAPRNVAAHELGHSLGLAHNSAAGTLMCGSCDMSRAEPGAFLPLTADDRAKLVTLYSH